VALRSFLCVIFTFYERVAALYQSRGRVTACHTQADRR